MHEKWMSRQKDLKGHSFGKAPKPYGKRSDFDWTCLKRLKQTHTVLSRTRLTIQNDAWCGKARQLGISLQEEMVAVFCITLGLMDFVSAVYVSCSGMCYYDTLQ